jgi:hypothetical protein
MVMQAHGDPRQFPAILKCNHSNLFKALSLKIDSLRSTRPVQLSQPILDYRDAHIPKKRSTFHECFQTATRTPGWTVCSVIISSTLTQFFSESLRSSIKNNREINWVSWGGAGWWMEVFNLICIDNCTQIHHFKLEQCTKHKTYPLIRTKSVKIFLSH